ncbi:putative spindle and kinetochore-associated protein [Helianthus debilis subsp. tardiflorus]
MMHICFFSSFFLNDDFHLKPADYNKIELDPLYEPVMDFSEKESKQLDKRDELEDFKSFITLPKDAYEALPSYMKSLASWEDLLAVVEKMNLHLKQKTKNHNFFTQDEVSSLDLGQHNTYFLVQTKLVKIMMVLNVGSKTRSYLLLLVKMNLLVVETIDGLISYKVL